MIRAAVAGIGLGLALAASAAEYGSIGPSGAVLFDGPSQEAERVSLAPPGMPVELVSLINRWVRVRDQSGQAFWVDRDDISPKRMLVSTRLATVRNAPRDDAGIVLQVVEGVLLEWLAPAPVPGWVQVRHADGGTGFVRAEEVWGL